MRGRIVKLVSNFYSVDIGQGQIVSCKARGVFKKRGHQPLVGDEVEVALHAPDQGVIENILPRKNVLLRPPVANMDQVCLVFSLSNPLMSFLLLDKFLVHVESQQLSSILCINKIDLLAEEPVLKQVLDKARTYEQMGYPVVRVSTLTGEGLEQLKGLLKDRTTVLAGQSGVGKTSLLNALNPQVQAQTGEVSRKLGRGRHTTRHVELLPLPDGGYLVDTPGFSQLDFSGIRSAQLSQGFVEFGQYAHMCRYRGCLHHKEPDCAVKEAVESGRISPERYSHYTQFLEELLDKEKYEW